MSRVDRRLLSKPMTLEARIANAKQRQVDLMSGDLYRHDLPLRQATARVAYDQTVSELIMLMGEDTHCNNVDADLWSLFSDLWKDVHGYRPRHFVTRREADEWINANTQIMED
jgi:hypothetical protein